MMMDSGEEESSSYSSKSPDYEKLRLLVPDLDSSKFHKGQAGKIGVVGGCEEYTGAPYFAAMSALRMGADLAHVFCAEGAGHVIKSYSPELIVHPYMREGGSGSSGGTHTAYDAELVTEAMEKIEPWLDRMSAVVVGPGLGRDPTMCETAKRIIAAACEKDIPLVIDADGIRLVMEDASLVSKNGRVVLTPNKAELDRFRDWGGELYVDSMRIEPDIAPDIAHILNGPVVVAKGEADVVVTHSIGDVEDMPENAHLEGLHEYSRSYVCDEMGSPRRCGGQGDVLAGTIATFLAWSTRNKAAECAIVSAAMNWEDDPDTEAALLKARNFGKILMAQNYRLNNVFASSASALAAYAGCLVTRVAARAAFDRKRRSMLASDVIEELGDTMQRLFPVETESDI